MKDSNGKPDLTQAPVPPLGVLGGPFDFWNVPATISTNGFKYKSLSQWTFNIAMGCSHACRFCYVPQVSPIRMGKKLARYGVKDPDAEWGDYVLLRPWDEKKFRNSLRAADQTDPKLLAPDSNRAVILCSMTDPFQVFRHPDAVKQQLLNQSAQLLVRRALEMIRDESTLNVRILTRSPLAGKFFELFKSFGDRLMLGMSLPTLDNDLAKIYEPKAPAPSQRLKTLQAARDAGLHVFVAMAPTYPECDEADILRTLVAIKELNPRTIFHEPINVRAKNVERIDAHARSLGRQMRTEVFATKESWWEYALDSLTTVQRLAGDMGLLDRLHLWPDEVLGFKSTFLAVRKARFAQRFPHKILSSYERQQLKEIDEAAYAEHHRWIKGWWSRVSEWADQPAGQLVLPADPAE